MLCLFQHSHCTLVAISFGTLARLFLNPSGRERALLSKFAPLFSLVEQALWRIHLVKSGIRASTLKMILARHARHLPPGGLRPLGLLFCFRWIFPILRRRKFWRRSQLCCRFCTLLFISCQKLQLSPSEHCPLACHCQHSPCPLRR